MPQAIIAPCGMRPRKVDRASGRRQPLHRNQPVRVQRCGGLLHRVGATGTRVVPAASHGRRDRLPQDGDGASSPTRVPPPRDEPGGNGLWVIALPTASTTY